MAQNKKQIIETKADDDLVEKSYERIRGIIFTTIETAVIEVGKYIIKEFYGGNIEKARKKEPVKGESYLSLFQKFQNSDIPYGKSWLYDTVRVVIQRNDIEKQMPNFQISGKINISHEKELLRIKDTPKKIELIEEIEENDYSVQELRDKINGDKSTNSTTNASQPAILKIKDITTGVAFLDDNKNLWTVESLSKKNTKQLKKMREAVNDKNTAIKQKLINAVKLKTNLKKAIANKKSSHGANQWTDFTYNICLGCENDCLYCYARRDRINKNKLTYNEWKEQILLPHKINGKMEKYPEPVMFPSTHDITPDNLEAYKAVLQKLLDAGNNVIIVSKPRPDCIKDICENFANYKDRIVLRFTIGASDSKILEYWEPKAPDFNERLKSLKYAFKAGFTTSVSIEPMLDSNNIDDLISKIYDYVNQRIWIGTLNHIKNIKNIAKKNLTPQEYKKLEKKLAQIEKDQSIDKINAIHQKYKDNKKIEWKKEIANIVGIEPFNEY